MPLITTRIEHKIFAGDSSYIELEVRNYQPELNEEIVKELRKCSKKISSILLKLKVRSGSRPITKKEKEKLKKDGIIA